MATTSAAPSAGDAFAHVRVGRCDVAIPVADIVQAIDIPAGGMTPLPRRRGALAGLVALDGSAVPVVALDRWVELGPAGDAATARIVVLRAEQSLVGIQVDALMGIKRVGAAAFRPVHHTADADELFEAVASATASRPLLCLLEVRRLMALADAWCAESGLRLGAQRAAAADRLAPRVRHAVLQIGDARWAVPATAIASIAETPVPELHWAGQLTCGICPWEGRKLPLVDLAFAESAGKAVRPWMAVVADGPHGIGIVVSHCDQLLDLSVDDVQPTPGHMLMAGTAAVAGLGAVCVLDVDKLFSAVPEARISRHPAGAGTKTAAAAASAPAADSVAHYLVFEADRHYASPAAGLAGVVALPAETIDDLAAGRRATVVWRGRPVDVVNFPSIDGKLTMADPRLAVVVEDPGAGQACSAIAIRSLGDWLPAQAARRSGMRINAVGDISVITSPRTHGGASLVVVDLAQMAYLLN